MMQGKYIWTRHGLPLSPLYSIGRAGRELLTEAKFPAIVITPPCRMTNIRKPAQSSVSMDATLTAVVVDPYMFKVGCK